MDEMKSRFTEFERQIAAISFERVSMCDGCRVVSFYSVMLYLDSITKHVIIMSYAFHPFDYAANSQLNIPKLVRHVLVGVCLCSDIGLNLTLRTSASELAKFPAYKVDNSRVNNTVCHY